MRDLEQFLRQEGVDPALLDEAQEFRRTHTVDASVQGRIPQPVYT